MWGQADGYNPALSPTLHNRKFHRGKVPNVKAPAIPRHCGDNQKVIALHLSPAIPVGGGGMWIQVTGALRSGQNSCSAQLSM